MNNLPEKERNLCIFRLKERIFVEAESFFVDYEKLIRNLEIIPLEIRFSDERCQKLKNAAILEKNFKIIVEFRRIDNKSYAWKIIEAEIEKRREFSRFITISNLLGIQKTEFLLKFFKKSISSKTNLEFLYDLIE